ncbi:hypothetical protein [Halolamina salifodinae]|uniref:Uncharacterized protein n=1 Tax=Halolamina salifodinae TaxID=1202767 RepID=A0A8T4GSV2_9EURY|nr:hypothetical protein [Halolamina salifodinae]MBP1985936.1 hypothetical protein [Halolamina salifodinae]
MLTELVVTAVEMTIGHIGGLSTAVGLLVGYHYLGKTAALGGVLSSLRGTVLILGGLVLAGAVEINPSALLAIGQTLLELGMGFLP